MIETGDTLNEHPAENQVALLCSDGFEQSQRMFLMESDRGEWRLAPIELEATSIKGIPDGPGVLLLGQSTEEDRTHSQVWSMTPDGEQLLFEEQTDQSEAARASWEIQEFSGRLVISIPDIYRGYSRYISLDLRQCLQGACQEPAHSMASRPVWSPEGDRLLVREFGLLWRRQDVSSVPVGDGTSPFWLDERTFGYVRSAGRQQAVVLTSTDGGQDDQVILTANDLIEAFDAEQRPARILIGRVLVSSDETAPWRILVFDLDRSGGMGQARFVAYDPGTGHAMMVPHSGRLLSFNMSPSGRWLAAASFDEGEGRWIITVTDQYLVTEVEHRLAAGGSAGAVPSYSWSADEEWLLILEQGLMTLFNPSTGSYHRIAPPAPGCVQAAWYGAIQPDGRDESLGSVSP
jgi:hypothetical protein